MSRDLVFDIETERTFDEVGGRENLTDLGVTVVGVYSYESDKYFAFESSELPIFSRMLENSDRIIGFNSNAFDIPILRKHVGPIIDRVKSLDLMDNVESSAGFRISLDNLAGTTLGARKSGSGLDAIKWWRQGKRDLVKKYCLMDVELTKKLYEHGKEKGLLKFRDKRSGETREIPVSWTEHQTVKAIKDMLAEGFQDRKTVSILLDSKNTIPEPRLVDIYKVDSKTIEGYCHKRKNRRIYTIESIKHARLTDSSYQLEEDVQQSLLA
jgi:hypothetical protein